MVPNHKQIQWMVDGVSHIIKIKKSCSSPNIIHKNTKSEVGGESAPEHLPRTGKSFRFVRACARCILCLFALKMSESFPVSFIFWRGRFIFYLWGLGLSCISEECSKRVLEESAQRERQSKLSSKYNLEFSNGVHKESCQRESYQKELSQTVLKESCQREFAERVPSEIFSREFSKRVLRAKLDFRCSTGVFKQSLT